MIIDNAEKLNNMYLLKRHILKYGHIYLFLFITIIFFRDIFLHPERMFYSNYSEVFGHTYLTSLLLESTRIYQEIPLWNPYGSGGTTFLGYSASAMFYPFNLPLYFLSPNLFHIFVNYSIFFHIVLGGLFTYIFVKKIGLDNFSAFISAILFSFSGKLITNFIYAGSFVHMGIVLLPLMLTFLECAIEKRSYFYASILGITASIQFLGIHPQLFYYSMIVLLIYSIARSLKEKDYSIKKLLKLNSFYILAVIIVLLITSFQLYHILEFSKNYSTRALSGSYSLATTYSLPPIHLISFLLPDFFGNPVQHTTWGAPNYWELNAYIGLTALLLAIVAIICRRNFYTLFFAILGIMALLFSMGYYTPIFYILSKFPGVTLFRAPSRMLHIYSFSIAVLAGIGISYIISDVALKSEKFFKKALRVLFVAGVLLLFCAAIIYINKGIFLDFGKNLVLKKYNAGELPIMVSNAVPLTYYMENVETVFYGIFSNMTVIILSMLFASTALYIRFKFPKKIIIFKLMIVLLLLFELWSFDMKFTETRNISDIFANNPVIEFLQKDSSFYRVLDLTDITHPYIAIRHGINIFRFHEVETKHFSELLDQAFSTTQYMSNDLRIQDIKNHDILAMLNFKYIISKDRFQNEMYQLVYSDSTNYVYENKMVMPRAFIVHKVISVDKGESPKFLSNVDILSSAIIEDLLSLEGDKPVENAEIILYSPNRVVIRANNDYDGLLVFTDTWLPEWKVFVNGKEARLYKTNHAIRGVFLSAGENVVVFAYQPPYYISLLLISIVTILGLLIYFGFVAKKHFFQRKYSG